LVSHCFSHHGLASARGPLHEHAAGWVDTDAVVLLGVREWEFDCFAHLLLLQVLAADVVVGHIWFFTDLHHLDCGVCLRRQDIYNGIRTLV